MASATNGAGNADSNRYKNYVAQLERQQSADVQDKEELHKEKITRLIDNHGNQESQLKNDYNVQISNEAETLENKLNLIRERNKILVDQERSRGDKEADQIRTQYQQKIEHEKKMGDEQINRMQEYYKKASDELRRLNAKEQNRETPQKGSAT